MRIKELAIGLVLSQLPTASIASTAGDELPLAASGLADSTDFNSAQVLSGYEVEDFEIELSPGHETVGITWGNWSRATWGSSYATSTEYAFLYYLGRAKAAGNVFDGKRIIRVCIWYSRDERVLSPVVCSNAYKANGIWNSGTEVSVGAWDTLDWEAPKTIFNIRTVRINPTSF